MSNGSGSPDMARRSLLETSLEAISTSIIERLTALSAVRDQALGDCRQLVRWSANSVRASHRGNFDEAARELEEARALAQRILAYTADMPNVYWAGYTQDAMKEFAEAAVTNAIIRGEPIPAPGDLGVEDAAYLNALAEAANELRRDTLDVLRGDNLARATELLATMDEIYALLVSIDFPDAITGGLRRSTDSLRAVLERTRGDVTVTLNQRRLERAVQSMQRSVGLDESGLTSPGPAEA
jgi:translin